MEDWGIGGFSRVERVERVEVEWGIGFISRGDAEARGIGELGCLTQRRREAESAEGIGEL